MSRTASRFQGISFATALHPEQPHCERTPFVTLILPADVVNRDAEAPSSTIGSPGLERALDVNPAQLDRALKWLQERLYILATTMPKQGRSIVAMYEIGQRGAAFLDAFDSFVQGADKRRDVLGEKPVRELITLAE